VVLVEGFHDLGEIQQRAAEAVDFVGDDAIDLPGGDIGQQAAEGWPLQGAAGVATVVVALRQAAPAVSPSVAKAVIRTQVLR
jgi:hypothetical protein